MQSESSLSHVPKSQLVEPVYSLSCSKGRRGRRHLIVLILTLALAGCVAESIANPPEADDDRGAPATSSPVSIRPHPGPQCVYSGSPPAAVSRRRATIRILTQNVFGLDRDDDDEGVFFDKDNCEARATGFGTIVANASPPYDIVALQEHWNSWDGAWIDCGEEELNDAIRSTGRYANSNNYYRNRPEGEWLDFETDGGLSIFTLHPIKEFDENEWDDIPRTFGIKTLHGSTFSQIKLNGTNVSVDFYNAHLLAEEADDCDSDCRRDELQELRAEIILHSRTSGNPVIVVGDFNIGGPPSCNGNDRYADIMEKLENPRDLWLEAHPGLNGFTHDCQLNTVIRDVSPCAKSDRIDFMFLVQSPNLTNSPYVVVLREANDMKLAEFTRPNGGHVSDHFGLEAILEIRERGRQNIPFVGWAH